MKLMICCLASSLIVMYAWSNENAVLNPGFEEVTPTGSVRHWSEHKPAYRFCDGIGRNQSRGLAFDNSDPHFYSFPTQKLNLRAGCCYAFEVWIKAEHLQGDESGATICMEWSDAQGKYIGGAYADGIRDTDGNWVRVHGVTRAIPTNAVRISVSPYVRKGITGKAWFDDLKVERYYPPLVTSLIASTYRNTFTQEPVTLFAGLTLAQSGIQTNEITTCFSIFNAVTQSPVLTRVPDHLLADRADIMLSADALQEGTYTACFTITTQTQPITTYAQTTTLYRVKQLPQRKVWIDRHQRLIVDNKPFFPLGMYWSKVTPDLIKTYRTGPFNCLMPYAAPTRQQMDELHANQLKVLYSIKDIYSGTKWAPKTIQNETDEVAFITKKVAEMKDHPALLAWYTNDELPATMETRLAARQRLLETLDPDHPTWIVLYQYYDVRSYLRTFDIVGTDPYPIPEKPLTEALIWARTTREQSFNVRPVWQVPQAFNWAAYRKNSEEKKQARPPTRDELRAMSWMSIAAGANGLVYYSFFDLYKMKDTEPFEVRWADVCAVAEEIHQYIPLILSTEPTPDYTLSGNHHCDVRVWRQNRDLYVLCASANLNDETITFKLHTPIASAQSIFGTPVHVQGDTLQLTVKAMNPLLLKLRPQEH